MLCSQGTTWEQQQQQQQRRPPPQPRIKLFLISGEKIYIRPFFISIWSDNTLLFFFLLSVLVIVEFCYDFLEAGGTGEGGRRGTEIVLGRFDVKEK